MLIVNYHRVAIYSHASYGFVLYLVVHLCLLNVSNFMAYKKVKFTMNCALCSLAGTGAQDAT